jgi:hypothetical protein
MSQKTLGIICALFVALLSDSMRASAEPDADVRPWQIEPARGEDLLVVRRNAVLLKMAEAWNNRVTIVKFDDDIETKCPTLTSLFFSAGNWLELLTPNFSLYDAAGTTIYSERNSAEGKSADFVVQNAACRYLLTVKRYDRDGEVEKEVQVRQRRPSPLKIERPASRAVESQNIPGIKSQVDRIHIDPGLLAGDEKIGFTETTMPFDNPSKPLNFTGIAFFAPTTFTVYLANVEKDLTIASESNFLTHTYKVEIKSAQAALRISINRELYSNGQWVNAFGN